MTEWLTYASIGLISLVLFYYWYRRQGRAAEKKWLLQQIKLQNDNQQACVDALARSKGNPSAGKLTGLAALLILPTALVIDALWFQDIPIDQRSSQVNNQSNGNNGQQNAPDLATAISQLEQKLAENPNDLEGQLLYGRSMMSLQRFAYAVGAYRKANELEPNNAHIMTQLAEAIAFDNNTGSFLGEPAELLKQAIQIEPNHQKAMWLYGIVLDEQGQYAAAEALWTDLLNLVESPNIKTTLIQQINRARASQGKAELNQAEQTPADDPQQANDSVADTADALYQVVVQGDDSFNDQPLPASARLFVYAKQVDGPPMPVAALVLNPPFKFPMTLQLNDRNSLNGERLLSSFETLKFSAKISLNGSATPADDDIISNEVTTTATDNNINLTPQ